MTWVALGIIVLVVLIVFWPCRKGSWEEFGDGYLYVYVDHRGAAVGEVFPERDRWTARVYGEGDTQFSTVEAAMQHVVSLQ